MDLLENPKLPNMLRHLNSNDFKKFNNFMWNGSHVTAVIRYVQKSCPDDDESIYLLERLEDSRGTYRYPKMVLSFMDKLRGFFTVPKMEYYKTNEVLASFLDFLLDTVEEISKSHADYVEPAEEQMEILHSQLKLLTAILGDAPFRRTDIDKTSSFLKEMEALANEVGEFLYLYFFTDEENYTRMDVSLSKLLKKLANAETKINEHIISASKLSSPVFPHNAAIDSLFIVDCLLNDLTDLLNRGDDVLGDVITTLQQELVLARSFVVVGGLKEHKQLSTRIIDAAYEAGYLIDSHVLGDVPVSYLTRRLADLIQTIKLVGIGLEEFMKNCDARCTISSFMVGDIPVWYPTPRFPDIVNNEKKTTKTFGKAPKNGEAEVSREKEEVIVGFKKEAAKISNQLVGGPKELQTVFICGMPGLGKTTLAKKVYNNPAVFGHFDRRAWCVASQTYRRKTLLMDILSWISDLGYDQMLGMDADKLGLELHQSLMKRRYIVVVDDIWNLNVWDDIRRYLPDSGNGSRVLLTSRNKDVAPAGSKIHSLPFLSNEECWDLLKKKVFPKEDEDCPQELVDTGNQIVAYSQGLPLAVVVIAAVLGNMNKKKRLWDEVVGSLNLQISKDPNKCMNIMELSYEHLPGHLKPCFLYFGTFPEDREISVRKLTSLWIAEGFIQKEAANKCSLQEVAEGYLADLINRSLVRATKSRSDGGVKTCATHDLLRLLCLRKAKDENFLNVVQGKFSAYERHHRLRIPHGSSNDVKSRPFVLHARSLLGRWSDISDSYSRLKRLRILDLSSQECPHDLRVEEDNIDLTGIEVMVYLRYLEVRLTAQAIPVSVCNLYNLEFLYFDGCGSVEIPTELVSLVKLRHLHVRARATFHKSLHTQAIQLKLMETISNLVIVDENDEKILNCFTNLRGLKCSTKPLWDSSEKCRRYLVLDYLTKLESLNLSYLSSEFKFKDTIHFPRNLKKLTLHELKLSWEEMSIIGELEMLQVLKLSYIVFVGKEWRTNDDEFSELKLLKLDGLRIQRWITSADHFPNLERLVMSKCWKLKAFPAELGDSVTLQTIDIYSCTESLAKSALQIQKNQEAMENYFKLNITGTRW